MSNPKTALEEGNRQFLAKNFSNALQIFEEILRMNPSQVEVLNNKGYCLGKMKDHEGALKCYESALIISPNDKTVLTNKISSLRKLKKYEEAARCCDQILSSDPDDKIILYHKERIMYSLGRYSESAVCCERILRDYPENIEVLFDLAKSLAKNGSSDMAVSALAICLKVQPSTIHKIRGNEAFASIFDHPGFLKVIQ